MGKTSACISIIQILSARNLVSKNELADILEINPRNIPEYIKEIELAGYSISTTRGAKGGYSLDKTSILPAIKLDGEEKKLLQEGFEFIEKSPEFIRKNEFTAVAGKVLGSFSTSNQITPLSMVDKYPLAIDKKLLYQRYTTIETAIESQTKLEVEYLSQKNIIKKHIIHPYKLLVYNGSWYVIVWNESVCDFGYMKLNRLESITPLKYHFSIMKTYDESKFIDDMGLKQYGEEHHVVLELKDVYTAVSERIYGKNQIIEQLDDNWLRLTCDMKNKDIIKTFVLSWGAKCRVIEPEWLREDIKAELAEIYKLY